MNGIALFFFHLRQSAQMTLYFFNRRRVNQMVRVLMGRSRRSVPVADGRWR